MSAERNSIETVDYTCTCLPLLTFRSLCIYITHFLSYIGFVISILTFRFLDSDPLSYIGFVYPFYV